MIQHTHYGHNSYQIQTDIRMKILFEYIIIVRAKKRGGYISHWGKVIAEKGREIMAELI